MSITKIIDNIVMMLDKFQRFQYESQIMLEHKIKYLKKKIVSNIIQFFLYSIGSLVLLVGIIMFLSRYFPTDYILIAIGILLLYVGIMVRLVNK